MMARAAPAKKPVKKVAKVASHVFDGVIAKLRREAKKIAHKLVPMFYKRMRGPIKKGLSKQSQIVLKTAIGTHSSCS